MRNNETGMNINGQINKALEDIRKCLIDQSIEKGHAKKARYTLEHALAMVANYRDGQCIPWSDIRPMIAEEFDDDVPGSDADPMPIRPVKPGYGPY